MRRLASQGWEGHSIMITLLASLTAKNFGYHVIAYSRLFLLLNQAWEQRRFSRNIEKISKALAFFFSNRPSASG
jgi:hypothetical protein